MTKEQAQAQLVEMKKANFIKWVDGLDRSTYLSMTYDDMFVFYNDYCIADGKKGLQIEPSEMNYIIRQSLYKK